MGSHPTHWQKYCHRVSRSRMAENAAINKFAARYKLAHSLQSVTFEGFTEKTNAAYAAATRVGLAYSALEALESALGLRKSEIVIPSALATRLRSQEFRNLFELLEEELSNKKLKTQILEFRRRMNRNVRPVVEGIRHLMFHGQFTAYGSGISSSKSRIKTLELLAEIVLNFADQEFSKWVEGDLQ